LEEPNVSQILADLLRDDERPPSLNYSAFDTGSALVGQLDRADTDLLLMESIRVLPGSLAESFLEGVFSQLPQDALPRLREPLFDSLKAAKEVTSAATVVSLIKRCQIPDLELVSRLLVQIELAPTERPQNIYSYALLCAITPEIKVAAAERIGRMLLKGFPLSDYSREILKSLIQ
jgi:hypothetical protein